MNYAILVYETESNFAARTNPEQQQGYWAGWMFYSKAVKDAGIFVSGAGLQPPETATTMKFDGEQRLVQDGPYADIKEQLAGFYVIDVPNLDVALEWAARCPRLPGRVIEIRPQLPPVY
jgi:hypothetical protein